MFKSSLSKCFDLTTCSNHIILSNTSKFSFHNIFSASIPILLFVISSSLILLFFFLNPCRFRCSTREAASNLTCLKASILCLVHSVAATISFRSCNYVNVSVGFPGYNLCSGEVRCTIVVCCATFLLFCINTIHIITKHLIIPERYNAFSAIQSKHISPYQHITIHRRAGRNKMYFSSSSILSRALQSYFFSFHEKFTLKKQKINNLFLACIREACASEAGTRKWKISHCSPWNNYIGWLYCEHPLDLILQNVYLKTKSSSHIQ